MRHGFIALMLAATVGLATPATAKDIKIGDLTIDHPWARASAGKAKNGAAYLTIINKGYEADNLVKVVSPAARTASLHNNIMEGQIMKMVPVKAITARPGKPAMLKPGGLHIMLMGLKRPLKEGEMLPITLTFEKAGSVDVMFMVKKVGSMGGMDMKGMKH